MYRYDNRWSHSRCRGTNLVFGAMQANKFIVETHHQPSNADNLDKCLATIGRRIPGSHRPAGRETRRHQLRIPGPGRLSQRHHRRLPAHFPSFRERLALGPFLEYKFGIPVFINNDGDLFAYGEALGGALPEVNAKLAKPWAAPKTLQEPGGLHLRHRPRRRHRSEQPTQPRRQLVRRNLLPEAQEVCRIHRRGRRCHPRRETCLRRTDGNPNHGLEPKELCDIADGKREGDAEAAARPSPKWANRRRCDGNDHHAHRRADRHRRGITGARKWIMPSLLKESARQDAHHHGRGTEPRADEGLRPGQRGRVQGVRQGRPACAEGLRHGSLRAYDPHETHRSHDLETRGEQCHLGGRLCIALGQLDAQKQQ